MRFSLFRLLRGASLAWALAFGACVVMTLPAVTSAQARRKRGRKRKARKNPLKRDIAKGKLAPKEDFGLDEDIGKTKDLKPGQEDTGPAELATGIGRARTLEDVLREKIVEEINLVRELLAIQTACDDSAPARFRLADLYWELSKREFFASQDLSKADKQRRAHEQRMKQLQRRTIDNYQQIVDDCPNFPDYPKVLFFLGSAHVELGRSQDAVQYFQRIIKEFTDSQWVGNSWFMVGEYFFDDKNDAHKALRAYKRAEEYRDSQTYGIAVYKQGWCHINTGDWDLALERFRTVVRISEDQRANMDRRGRVSLRREGLKDFVRSYSHVGDVKKAFRTFIKVGSKQDVEWMMESLGKWYINNDAHADIVQVYKELIRNYPKSTRLPLFQGRIVKAVSILDKRAVVAQSKLLTEYFKKTRARVARGEFDRDAETKKRVTRDIKEAEEIAENTLRGLAMDFHKDAKKLRGSARDRTYKIAHDLYKHYLTVFPKPDPNADVNYVFFMRFYYAEVLYKLEKFEEAANNYDMVVDMNPHPKKNKEKEIVLAAAENSVHSYQELVEDLDRKNPPKISGTEPKPIPPIKNKLIDSCQRYIKYVGSEGEKIVEIRYQVAYIYYTYNHFSEAAPAFNDIVANHPTHDRACFAANLTLDIYNGDKNYKALTKTARAYLNNSALACGEEDRKKFAQIEEQSSFKLIKIEYEDKNKNIEAAKAYLEFYKSFPKSDFADDAVYNAAYNYDLAQRLDKANEVREFLVKLPNADKSLVQETLYNIAASYERIVDFEKAARYLERYAQEYPNDDKSKDALFNAGLYRATLLQFDDSRRNREQFIRKYPRDKEVHQVAYSICESLEKEAQLLEASNRGDRQTLKKWEEVNDCYFNYVRNHDGNDDDSVCHAQFRRGEIMRTKTKYAKGYADQKRYLLKNWPRWKRKNKLEDLPRCAAALAEIEFRDLASEFKKYKELTISEINPTPKGMKRFEASVAAKVKARDAMIEKYKKVAEYGQVVSAAEWALASLFHIGEAYLNFVERILAAPIPRKVQGVPVPEEIKEELKAKLKTDSLAIEESAVEAYRICVDKANDLGVYTKWSVSALKKLQDLRPEEFPPTQERLAQVAFSDPLKVESNRLVVPDGSSWRSLSLSLSAKGVRPDEQKASDTKDRDKDDDKVTQGARKGKAKGGRGRGRRGRRGGTD